MVEAVLRALEVVSVALGWLSVGLLAAAVVVGLRRGADQPAAPVSVRGRVAQAVVVVPTVVAVASALALDVPLAYGWGSVLAVVLLSVVLRRDERFWVALALLFPVFLVTGVALLAALSHNYVDTEAGRLWYGGRQLEFWGGLHANPSAPHWEWTVVALAVTRYALPLALVVATAWVATVRGPMTRIERLGVVTAAQSLLATMLIGATFSVVVLGAGLLSGVPVPLVVVGVAGSLFALLTVGPGTVGGVIVEGRTLASRVPVPLQSAYAVAAGVADTRDADAPPDLDAGVPVWRSLVGFVSGEVTGLRRLNLILLACFGGFVALSLLGTMFSDDVPDNRAVRFEYIDEEVGVGYVVEDAFAVAPDAVWLVGNGHLSLFDPTTGELRPSSLRPTAATVVDGRLLVLTGEDESELAAVRPEEPDRAETRATLSRRASGLLAVTAGNVYVAGAGGRIRRFDRATGALEAETVVDRVDEPPVTLLASDGRLWTVHGEDRFERDIVERNPRTLEPIFESSGLLAGIELLNQAGVDPQLLGLVLDNQLSLGEVAPWQERSRTFLDADGRPRWRSSGLGTLTRLRGDDENERWDFHYDSINGVFEADDATWLLADDDQGTIVDETEPRETVLARWDGP